MRDLVPTTSPSVTNVDDAKLIDRINQANQRIVLVAPGVSEDVAQAVVTAWKHLGPSTVTVILDVDAEVCRLGLGTFEALTVLQDAATAIGTKVRHQPGVRIGLLISDDTTLIFSPTPLLIESESQDPKRPNAIELDTVPKQVAKDVGLSEKPNLERVIGLESDAKDVGLNEKPNLERVIGLDPVRPEQIEEVARDLETAPPVRFDLARRVRVFTSRFQFVELEMTGCYISRKKVPIPSRLVGLEGNRDVQSQFHAHFNLVNKGVLKVETGDSRTINEKTLQDHRQAIVRDLLIRLRGYGSVVMRANKQKFIDAVEELKADVAAFQKGVMENLQQEMDANIASLVEALLPAVERNPPDEYTKFHGSDISEDQVREHLEMDIRDAFGRAEALVNEMRVSIVFKDVAYESLVDEEFIKIARAAMPRVPFLHDEYEATPERTG